LLNLEDYPAETFEEVTHLHIEAWACATPGLRRTCLKLGELLGSRGATLSMTLDLKDSMPWSRYEAQTFFRTLLQPNSLLILPEGRLGNLFPTFWTREAKLEGGLDLNAGEVLLLEPTQGAATSVEGRFRNWDTPEVPEKNFRENLLGEILGQWLQGAPLETAVETATEEPLPEADSSHPG
jgi:hypothetical protein